MKNRLVKAVIAACMLFTVQAGALTNIQAAQSTTIADGSYSVPTSLMKSTDIGTASMAGGSLASEGTLEIKDGNWYLVAEFKTLDFGGMGKMFGNASDIKYYEGADLTQTPKDAEIVSYRDDAKVSQGNTILENQRAVQKVRIPVADNSKGVYISMFIDFMNMNQDAYIAFDLKAAVQTALTDSIAKAKEISSKDYTEASYAALQTAISNAEAAIANGADETELAVQVDLLNKAMVALEKPVAPEQTYNLADGTYTVPVTVLKENSDDTSMASSAVKGATIVSKGGVLTVTLDMGAVSVYGQTAYVDKVEYEASTGVYEEVTDVEKDSEGKLSKITFILPKNTKNTKVKFYYGGSPRGAAARLSLDLEHASAVSTSKFAGDGTYNVNIALWNASKDELSMAASALDTKATIIVKDGKAVMYMSTKKMTLGTIVAYLQEMKVGEEQASVVSKDADGNPTMFSFSLPSEEELIDVQVNPHVAIMGNSYIPARLKVDYASLIKVSEETTAPTPETSQPPVVEPGQDETTPAPTPTPLPTPETVTPTPDTGTPASGTQGSANSTTSTSTATGTAVGTKGNVQTSDATNTGIMISTLIASMGALLVLNRKRLCKQGK